MYHKRVRNMFYFSKVCFDFILLNILVSYCI